MRCKGRSILSDLLNLACPNSGKWIIVKLQPADRQYYKFINFTVEILNIHLIYQVKSIE